MDVYTKLSQHLDSLPAGFPKSKNDSEIKLLKKFYSPEQAQIALLLKQMPEPLPVLAKRLNTKLGMELNAAEKAIEKMAKDGLIFRIKTAGGPLYMQTNFLMGIYEWHVGNVDKEVAEYADDYYDAVFEKHWVERETKQLRIVPVNTSVDSKDAVKSYDRIRELVKGKSGGPYVVAPCMCRVEQHAKGNETTRPLETCLVFGLVAQYYIDNGMGRQLTETELMDKLDECEAAALVPFGTNSLEISNMCMCDKDSCQLLRNLRSFPMPSKEVHASLYSEIDETECNGCGKCTKRCQIDAVIKKESEVNRTGATYSISQDRCIGCGLCVAACPQEAISMVKKETELDIPLNTIDMNIRMAKERAKLGV